MTAAPTHPDDPVASSTKGLPRPDGNFLSPRRRLIGRFGFELFIVFVGVTAAFGLENYREAREQEAYYRTMVGGLSASLDDVVTHTATIDHRIATLLRSFDNARTGRAMPAPPVYREEGGERPPTRAWDGIVATGATRALDPNLFFRLARFYSRADSFGERYLRYNSFSESQVLPYLAEPERYYRDGVLRPEFAAHIERLRDLKRENNELRKEAAELRKLLKT